METTPEKRAHKRNHLICYLPVFDKKNPSEKLGHIIDISLGGVMLISEKKRTKNKIFTLEVVVSGEMHGEDKICFDAKCVWCKPDIKPNSYVSGFAIEEGFAEEQKKISALINECSINQYGFLDG